MYYVSYNVFESTLLQNSLYGIAFEALLYPQLSSHDRNQSGLPFWSTSPSGSTFFLIKVRLPVNGP